MGGAHEQAPRRGNRPSCNERPGDAGEVEGARPAAVLVGPGG